MNNFVKSLNLLTSEQKRNIVIVFLLLVLPVAAVKFLFVEEFMIDYVKDTPTIKLVHKNKEYVDRNRDIFDILKNAVFSYIPGNITADVKSSSYERYFSKRPPIQIVAKVQRKYNYGNRVSFIYNSGTASYVIIDDKIIRLGGYTKSGLKVIKIENKRVLLEGMLEGKRSSQWVTLRF